MKSSANMSKRFCLLEPVVTEFKRRLKSGEITPDKLNAMNSKERREYFETFMDKDSALETNVLFEKKLLLKNKERGMIRWAEQLTGVTTKQRARIIEQIKKTNEERLRRAFSPAEEEQFLNDLVDQRLGLNVGEEEAKTIFALSKKLQEGKELFDSRKVYDRLKSIVGELDGEQKRAIDTFLSKIDTIREGKKINNDAIKKIKKYLSGQEPSDTVKKKVSDLVDEIVKARKANLNYGAARVALDDYVGDIKLGIKEPYNLSMETAKRVVTDVAGFAKSMLASIDNSFIGRQGIKVLFSGHPAIWLKTLGKSFQILGRAIGGEDMLRGVRAQIYGRPNAMNGTYDRMKLAVGQAEEAFPTSLPEKIPLFGRLFSASQQAFTGSAYYMRAELADLMIRKRVELGVDMASKANAESLGTLINSMTGRGTAGLGKLGKTTNTLLFSPKFLQSNLDTLTAHIFDKNVTALDKLEAGKNLAKIVTSIGAVLYMADKLQPGSVEWDARSSDFGKIRIGDTRFDVTGGMGSIVTLLARLNGTKSSTTGIVTAPGDYNGRNALDLFAGFAENKLSPFFGTLVDIAKREDFNGDPYTMEALKKDPKDVTWRLVKGLVIPIPAANAEKNFKEYDNSTALLYTLIDGLGFGSNTYGFTNNWNKNTSAELKAFKEKVGKETFEQENESYAKTMNKKIISLKKDDRWNAMDDKEKESFLESLKRKEKDKIFEKHGFEYERTEREAEDQETRDQLLDEVSN